MSITNSGDRGTLRLAPWSADGHSEPRSKPLVSPGSARARLTRRPGERYELWPAPKDGWFDVVSKAADERRLEASTVAAVLLERHWVVEQLQELELGHLLDGLDRRAAKVRVSESLWSASAGYLRYLAFGAVGAASNADDLALPARLSDRLQRRWPIRLDPSQVQPAIYWEMAAVVDGLSSTEWSLHQALAARTDPA